jgi:prepilin-type N-terminal cleavage/methylation domain-containing protein
MASLQSLKGFTLIEMIVTISIMLVVIGGSIAAFSAFQDRKKVEQAARDVHQLVVMAATKTSVGERPSPCAAFTGYRVRLVTSNLILYGMCDGSQVENRRIALPAGVTYTIPTVTFAPLHGGVGGLKCFQFSGYTATYSFSVSATGVVGDVTPTACP